MIQLRGAPAYLACVFFLLVAPAGQAAEPAPAHSEMVVAADPYAVKAGMAILHAGGSAVDATIAVQLVLNLVEPQSSGIGGGAFLLVANPDGTMNGYDGREKAPAGAKPDQFMANGKPMSLRDAIPGGLSVGVPGDIAVMAMAHKAHGKLPWAKLFEPAIELATNGFKVPPRLAAELAHFSFVKDMPDTRAAFYHADGTPLAEGEMVKSPAFAETLRRIAQGGPDAFYEGPIAAKIAAAVHSAPVNPGSMTVTDLANYRAVERPSLCAPYRAYKVCSIEAGSGGVTVLEILELLQRFSPDELKPNSLSEVHLVSEASKLAYADRIRWMGDPAFVPAPIHGLLDPAYIRERSALIDPEHAAKSVAAGTPPMRKSELIDFAPQRTPTAHGTSHISVVDRNGEVTSMTTSIESAFGSKLMVGGFLLNNELTDFSFEPEVDGRPVANAVAPGKRPLSAMSPMIVFGPDGKFFAAIGSPGGKQIIAYVAQSIIALIDGHANMEEAVSLPHHVDEGRGIVLETGTSLEALAPALRAMGHTVTMRPQPSGLNGIRAVPGGFEGGSDPRRDGVAIGD